MNCQVGNIGFINSRESESSVIEFEGPFLGEINNQKDRRHRKIRSKLLKRVHGLILK